MCDDFNDGAGTGNPPNQPSDPAAAPPTWPPPPDLAGVARAGLVCDALLGGAMHTAADRQVADAIFAAEPAIGHAARHTRAFGHRVITTLLEHEIEHVIDLGAGAPSPLGLCSMRANGITRVLAVDADPVITELHRQECQSHCTAVQADIRDIDTVLDAADTHLDLTEPVGLMATGVLHHLTDDDHPGELLRQYTKQLAPGSVIALTHPVTDEGAPDLAHAAKLLADATGLPIRLRTWSEVFRLLPPGRLLPPFLTLAAAWRPNGPYAHHDPASRVVYAAVIHKARRSSQPGRPRAVSLPAPPNPLLFDSQPAAAVDPVGMPQ